MTKIRISFIFFFIIHCLTETIQAKDFSLGYDKRESRESGISLVVGYTYNQAELLKFNHFLGSYNAYFADHLETQFDSMYLGSSPHIAFGWSSRFISFQLNYAHFHNLSKAMFKSGEGREFELFVNSFGFDWDIMAPLETQLSFGITVGGSVDRGVLYSGYRYADGSISYAMDKQLNGIYEFQASSFILGLKGVFRTNWGNFFVKAARHGIQLTTAELYARDDRQGGPYLFGNHTMSLYLPSDIKYSNEINTYFIGLTNTIPNVLRGNKITIGFTYFIGKK